MCGSGGHWVNSSSLGLPPDTDVDVDEGKDGGLDGLELRHMRVRSRWSCSWANDDNIASSASSSGSSNSNAGDAAAVLPAGDHAADGVEAKAVAGAAARASSEGVCQKWDPRGDIRTGCGTATFRRAGSGLSGGVFCGDLGDRGPG